MEYISSYSDERHLAFCVHCGGLPDTRDHAPSKVLLDEPFPPNLAVIGACRSCNTGFSEDETYLACWIDCEIAGSAFPEDVGRDKVRRILDKQKRLQSRLLNSFESDLFEPRFHPEAERIERVVLKLARCHAAYENGEPKIEEPTYFVWRALKWLSSEQRTAFEEPPHLGLLPEVGSRAMQRVLFAPDARAPWINVQEGRYRYLVAAGEAVIVRLVLSEYLACEVVWTD